MRAFIEKQLERYNWGKKYRVERLTEWHHIIVFPDCKVELYFNERYSWIECRLSDHRQDSGNYEISTVLEFNDKEFSDLFIQRMEASKNEFIMQYISVLHERLLHVVHGDFSWRTRVEEVNQNTQEIIEGLGTYEKILESDIYKKMRAGDDSWKVDLNRIRKEKR